MTVGTIDNNGTRQLTTGISGVDDNDTVINTGDVSDFGKHYIIAAAGAVDVFVMIGNSVGVKVALTDLLSTEPATKVIVTSPSIAYSFKGHFSSIVVQQNGATAATGVFMLSVQ